MLFLRLPDMRQHTIYPDCDIKFTGHVTWVGKTSIEAKMHMSQVDTPTHSHAQDLLCVIWTHLKKRWVLRCKKSKSQHKRERCDSSLSSTMEPTPRCWTLHSWWWHEIQRTRGRETPLTHTQTHKQQVLLEEGSGSLSECKEAMKLLNAFIWNVFLLSYHRIMGGKSRGRILQHQTQKEALRSILVWWGNYLKMTSIIYDVTLWLCGISCFGFCATSCARHRGSVY